MTCCPQRGRDLIFKAVTELLQQPWDLVIAFPPCTYLANSGVRWLHERPDAGPYMDQAAEFFRACLNANAPRVAVENPVMHKYGVERVGRTTATHNPALAVWRRGDQANVLLDSGLPILEPTDIVETRVARVHRASPGKDRWKERSRTLPGIARARLNMEVIERNDRMAESEYKNRTVTLPAGEYYIGCATWWTMRPCSATKLTRSVNGKLLDNARRRRVSRQRWNDLRCGFCHAGDHFDWVDDRWFLCHRGHKVSRASPCEYNEDTGTIRFGHFTIETGDEEEEQ